MKKSFEQGRRRENSGIAYKHDLGQHFLYDEGLLRSLVQILFVYFGLLPAIAMIAVGYLLGAPLLFVGLAILLHVAITALSLVISPLFIERGRK